MHYPYGAGGNFLINCLSLTDQCVLRNSVLAEQQLDQNFGTQKKIDYLQHQLEKSLVDNKWQDLGLGDMQLFGIDHRIYQSEYPELIEFRFSSVIRRLIKKQKYLFLNSHSTQVLKAQMEFWTNSKVIFFQNYHSFVQERGYSSDQLFTTNHVFLIDYWNKIKGPEWPSQPPVTLDEFSRLPDSIQIELQQDFHGEIFRWLDRSKLYTNLYDQEAQRLFCQFKNRAYTWDVAKTFSGNFSAFFEELCKCAKWADINIEADKDTLEEFYHKWLHVIFVVVANR